MNKIIINTTIYRINFLKKLVILLFISLMVLSVNCTKNINTNIDFNNVLKSISSNYSNSQNIIFVTNIDPSSYKAEIICFEKVNNQWIQPFDNFEVNIGKKGFADLGKKIEGDLKTPSGIYPLKTAFGYLPSIKTEMNYQQMTKSDYWVDDVNSPDYNKLVRGTPNAKSFEKMLRDDEQYKFGIIVEYNTAPIIKGKGSAIFIHVWKNSEHPTAGCISMPEEKILKLLGWLNLKKEPLIVLGGQSYIDSLKKH